MVNNLLRCLRYAAGTLLLSHFGSPHTLIQTKKSPKSFVSPTSTKCARNPFVSPTYAKTGGGTFELSTGHPAKDAHPERAPRVEGSLRFSPNSNHSRTYESFSRKSNYSRRYANTGGWGSVIFMVTYLKYVGAPTIPFWARRERRRRPEGGPYKSKEQPASEGGPYTNFQPSTLNFEPSCSGSGNILGGGCVLLDRGARGCLPRRG